MTLHVETRTPERAILLLNLGGPETLDEVRPFLLRLFSDPEILAIKWAPLRTFVAQMIALTRTKKSRELYARIGGGSPIRRHTDAQSAALERLLLERGRTALVKTAFTCSAPFVEEVVRNLYEAGVRRVLGLPLYPHYSFTTTRGALRRLHQSIARFAPNLAVSEIRAWPEESKFLSAHVERIRDELRGFSGSDPSDIHLLFSAHSIPQRLVEEGDPYRDQIEQTVRGILTELGWEGNWSLAWQSKVGPVKWLEPSTFNEIERLGKASVKRLLVVPVAFVSDHIETLVELDQDAAKIATAAGIAEYRRAQGLNDHPLFIEALADLVERQEGFWR